jgi:hypothetical protein
MVLLCLRRRLTQALSLVLYTDIYSAGILTSLSQQRSGDCTASVPNIDDSHMLAHRNLRSFH